MDSEINEEFLNWKKLYKKLDEEDLRFINNVRLRLYFISNCLKDKSYLFDNESFKELREIWIDLSEIIHFWPSI